MSYDAITVGTLRQRSSPPRRSDTIVTRRIHTALPAVRATAQHTENVRARSREKTTPSHGGNKYVIFVMPAYVTSSSWNALAGSWLIRRPEGMSHVYQAVMPPVTRRECHGLKVVRIPRHWLIMATSILSRYATIGPAPTIISIGNTSRHTSMGVGQVLIIGGWQWAPVTDGQKSALHGRSHHSHHADRRHRTTFASRHHAR